MPTRMFFHVMFADIEQATRRTNERCYSLCFLLTLFLSSSLSHSNLPPVCNTRTYTVIHDFLTHKVPLFFSQQTGQVSPHSLAVGDPQTTPSSLPYPASLYGPTTLPQCHFKSSAPTAAPLPRRKVHGSTSSSLTLCRFEMRYPANNRG